MKFNGVFILKQIGGTYYAVPTGKTASEMKCMIKLNETSAFLWNHAQNGADEKKLAELLVENFSIDAQRAEADVESFVSTLKGAKIIE